MAITITKIMASKTTGIINSTTAITHNTITTAISGNITTTAVISIIADMGIQTDAS